MSRTTWTDATGYNRGERGTVEPRVWDLDVDGMRVTVHRFIGCDGWFGTCHAMGVDRHMLSTGENVEEAKAQFLDYLLRRANRWAEELGRAATPGDGGKGEG